MGEVGKMAQSVGGGEGGCGESFLVLAGGLGVGEGQDFKKAGRRRD